MRSEIQSIAEKALKLPPPARAYLAQALIESLDMEEDFAISDEWMAEIRRRCRETDGGDVRLVSGQKAMERLREKYS